MSVALDVPVIQLKFTNNVALGTGDSRSCAFQTFEEQEKAFCKSDNYESESEASSIANSSTSSSAFSPLSLYVTRFVHFTCNSESQLVSSPETTASLITGGLQGYLIQNFSREEISSQKSCMANGNCAFGILNLPDSIQLHIFSFLDAKMLCTIANVCLRWNSLSCDELLWHQRLRWDSETWCYIGSNTNPDSFENNLETWSKKEIYLRCSPIVADWAKNNSFILHRLSHLFRSFWPRKVPKIAMFGPGLESSTSFLVRKILEDQSGMFRTVGMFPGKFDGVGSGFTVRMNNCISLDLITIYNEAKGVREKWSPAERLQKSRMLHQNADQHSSQSEPTFELQNSIKDLCRTLGGLIFVVDATLPPEDISLARPELFAMANDQWTQHKAPVLVLSCTPDTNIGHPVSCRSVAKHLQLEQLNRSWQVHNCCIDTMEGIESAIHWLVETCHCS